MPDVMSVLREDELAGSLRLGRILKAIFRGKNGGIVIFLTFAATSFWVVAQLIQNSLAA
jgi:hypothetical protein